MTQRRGIGPIGPPLSEAEMKKLRLPQGALPAEVRKQRRRDMDPVRYYYVDAPFACRLCGKEEVWTAEQQKFWYEDCKGDPNAVAIHCHGCRKKRDGRSGT
jgi:hypothetical protein